MESAVTSRTLTLDMLLNALTAEGLANLLNHNQLGSLTRFNGFPLNYTKLEDNAKWRVSNINGSRVVFNDIGWVTEVNGFPAYYDEVDKRVTRINSSLVEYSRDELSLKAVRLAINKSAVLTDKSGIVNGVNGKAVLYSPEGLVSGINGHPVTYGKNGGITKINGSRVTYSEGNRPASSSLIILAAIFPYALAPEKLEA